MPSRFKATVTLGGPDPIYYRMLLAVKRLLLEAWRLKLETFFWSSIDEAQPQLFMGIPGPIYLTPGPSLHADATVSAMDQGSSLVK